MEDEIKKTINPTVEQTVVYRKFDSDDVIRLRSETLKANVVNGKENIAVDTGLLQKFTIVLGVKSCKWFSDVIDEKIGITSDIFDKRSTIEFRKIPVTEIDKMFKEGQKFNNAEYDVKELRKN